jgi:hypothetical protein
VIWTRVYDPLRTPAHWTDLIRAGQYAVFLFDIRTHVPRDAAGLFLADGGGDVAICASLDDAVEFARSVVARHPELCAEVYDDTGKSSEPLRVIYDPSVQGRYQGRPVARRETVWGLVFLVCGVSLFVVDLRHEFAWIWGYVIGLKMVIIGSALLVRGFAGLYEHRQSRRRSE